MITPRPRLILTRVNGGWYDLVKEYIYRRDSQHRMCAPIGEWDRVINGGVSWLLGWRRVGLAGLLGYPPA